MVVLLRLRVDQFGDTVAELRADVLHREIRVFHDVMEHRRRKKLRFGRHRRDNRHRLQWMHDIREVAPPPRDALMGLHGENDRLVDEACVNLFRLVLFHIRQ